LRHTKGKKDFLLTKTSFQGWKRMIRLNENILKLCIDDNRKAIATLYEYCFHKLMPVCFRYHFNEEDARSSYNVGFIKILRGLPHVSLDLNFDAWAKRIMVNTLIDEYRRKKKREQHISYKETERELEVSVLSIENEAVSNTGCESILALIKELPEVSAKVFNLYVLDGYSHKEIGGLLGISEGTSKWHLSTARKTLRERLTEMEQNHRKQVV
jgi:RNA polymerase sigma factor (sigma-70 family)